MDLGLMGRSVLITGGSGGVGFATARAFAAEGCALHLAARTAENLFVAQESITHDFDVRVTVHAVDLSNAENARRLARACSDVEILVNNAGAIPGGTIEEVDDERWHEAWNLKVFGYVNMMRALYAEMKGPARGGRHRQRYWDRGRPATFGIRKRCIGQLRPDGAYAGAWWGKPRPRRACSRRQPGRHGERARHRVPARPVRNSATPNASASTSHTCPADAPPPYRFRKTTSIATCPVDGPTPRPRRT